MRCQICAVSIYAARNSLPFDPPAAREWDHERRPLRPEACRNKSVCSILPDQSGCQDLGLDEIGFRHISGPGCTWNLSYNGSKISHQEMQGSEDACYIVHNPYLERGQSEYQKEFSFCIPQNPVYRDNGSRTFYFRNTQLWSFAPRNYPCHDEIYFGEHSGYSTAFPVHVWCWKIFETVCSNKLGTVDLQGFGALLTRQACVYCGIKEMPHHAAIARNRGITCRWEHTPGTEFLVANPQDIPGYLFALQPGFSSSRLKLRFRNDQTQSRTSDIFLKLPNEICDMILRELRNIDLLNLQKASRAFWLTDSKLYLYYIHRDFPWFNEFEQVKQLDETYHIEVEAARSSEVAIEKQIHLRTADPFWIEHYAALEKLAKGRVAPVRTTNWRQLYKNLHYAKRDIKGVEESSTDLGGG